MALAEASADVLESLAAQLDVWSLLALSQTSRSLRWPMREALAARCKRECLGTFLFPTVAAYRMQAPVPESWMQLYGVFSRLRRLRWTKCKSDGVSSSLRSLKSDNQEYLVDVDGEYMLRSGGHYWFSVWETKVDGIRIGRAFIDQLEGEKGGLSENGAATSLAFLRSPRQILFGKWTKARGVGRGPCPRRYHSMTSLPKTVCPASLMQNTDATNGKITVVDDPNECIRVRRLLFFGGHSETMPFDAFNDLHLLFIEDLPDTTKNRAAWVAPAISGTPPTPRCGHTATLLSPDLLLFAGGSDGTSPIAKLEVHLLHVEGLSDFRWSTPQSNETPMGRSLHDVYRVSRDELIIYGGRQIRESNALLSVHRLKLAFARGGSSSDVERLEWSSPRLAGSLPNGRRGHSTTAVGESLLLFGGQDEATGQLRNDLRVLHVPTLRWRRADVPGEAPSPRRGFKSQFFGTSLVVSSGFVRERMDGRADRQLPDSDVHVLEFL